MARKRPYDGADFSNRSTTRTGSTGPRVPPQKTYTTRGLVNQNAGSSRVGQSYSEFTVAGRPGVTYHEYVDPKTGKKQVVSVRRKAA